MRVLLNRVYAVETGKIQTSHNHETVSKQPSRPPSLSGSENVPSTDTSYWTDLGLKHHNGQLNCEEISVSLIPPTKEITVPVVRRCLVSNRQSLSQDVTDQLLCSLQQKMLLLSKGPPACWQEGMQLTPSHTLNLETAISKDQKSLRKN